MTRAALAIALFLAVTATSAGGAVRPAPRPGHTAAHAFEWVDAAIGAAVGIGAVVVGLGVVLVLLQRRS